MRFLCALPLLAALVLARDRAEQYQVQMVLLTKINPVTLQPNAWIVYYPEAFNESESYQRA